MTPTLCPDTQTPVFPSTSAFQKATNPLHPGSEPLLTLCFEGAGKGEEVINVTEGVTAENSSSRR